MRGSYHITEEDKKTLTFIIEALINHLKVHSGDDIEEVSLNCLNVGPCQVIEVLEDLGYERISFDSNGWEGDSWWSFSKEGEVPVGIFYSGYSFEMSMSLNKDDMEED